MKNAVIPIQMIISWNCDGHWDCDELKGKKNGNVNLSNEYNSKWS